MSLKRAWPAALVFLLSVGFVIYRLAGAGWDPVAVAEIGSRFAEGDPAGSEGYDGQFAVYMALDPDPESVSSRLDEPAYRYQRALYPFLGRVLGLGRPDWIPWALIAVNVAAHTIATYAVAASLDAAGQWVGFSLLYGLWAGVIGGVGLDLHEPLAYGLVAVGFLLRQKGELRWSAAAFGAAVFAKETTLAFLLAVLVADGLEGRWRRTYVVYGSSLFAFGAWQLWLLSTFGEFGLGSGGAMATAFEWLPFMGLWRVAEASRSVLLLYLLLFGPGIILPALWAIYRAGRELLEGKRDALLWALLINALLIVFLPHSTFREPFGLVRVATGLVLALLLYAGWRGMRRPLVYGWFWVSYLVMLI